MNWTRLPLLLGATLVCVCTEPDLGNGPDREDSELPTELQVSNPVVASTLSAPHAARILADENGENVVYVALPTGAVPQGARAAVRRVGDELPINLPVLDGGFDPVAIRALPTDSIEIVVTNAAGGVLLSARAAVKPSRPPKIVRTFPPRKKSDMPLNSSMVVVVGEPLDRTTVSTKSVRLFAGRREIAGSVQVLDDGTSVAFTPDAELERNQEYRLVLGAAIADLEGETLGSDFVVGFRTGTSLLGPPARLVVSPDSLLLLVGSTYQFSARVFDADDNLLLAPVTWTTPDPDALSISAAGLATARQTSFIDRAVWAKSAIQASVGSLSSAAFIVVVPEPASIELLPAAATMAVGDSLLFEVVTRASNAVFNARIRVPLTVSNSSPAAASMSPPSLSAIEVSPFRTVKALAYGSTRITVKAGNVTAATDITVNSSGPVASVRVAPATAELAVADTLQLRAWLRDAGGTEIQDSRPVSWSSSNTLVLKASENGLVTAVGNGTATITATSEGKSASASLTVTAQPREPTFAEVTTQFWQTCAVTPTRDTYCWGRFYEPGGQFQDLRIPRLLHGGLDLAAIAPSGGSTPGYLCGRADQGETFCWNYYSSVPRRFGAPLKFSDLSASEQGHACGVATDGNTYCWGTNTYGQLGDGTTVIRPGTPTAVIGGHTFKSITVGRYHSCGITLDGDAYCWGADADPLSGAPDRQRGILGAGALAEDRILLPRRVAGDLKFAQLSAGIRHTCGITTGGKAYCWGANAGSGTVGDGTVIDRNVPTAVSTSLTFSAVAAGGFSNCAIATSGAIYCWGSNSSGQLGTATQDCQGQCSLRPVAVQGNLSFSRISVGALHACGIATTGRLYCWGDNFGGQLGDGTNVRRSTPAPLARP